MKKARVFLIYCFIHLLLILFVSILSCWSTSCEFYDIPKNKIAFYNSAKKILSNPIVSNYLYVTGAETGYGFFAPNVLTTGFLQFEIKRKKYLIQFSSQENNIRYSNLCSKLIQDIVQPDQSVDTIHLLGEYKKYQTIGRADSLYDDLIVKNLIHNLLKRGSNSDTIKVALEIYNYPRLNKYDGNRYHKPYLIPLFEKQYYHESK